MVAFCHPSGAQSEVIDLNTTRARLFPLKQTLVSSTQSLPDEIFQKTLYPNKAMI